MMCPLPSVEIACAAVQQEESQKQVLSHSLCTVKVMEIRVCSVHHVGVTSYPNWHHKYKHGAQKFTTGKWSSNKATYPKMVKKCPRKCCRSTGNSHDYPTTRPAVKNNSKKWLFNSKRIRKRRRNRLWFSGMVSSRSKQVTQSEWIIDSGALDHMTSSRKNLNNVKPTPSTFTINLPTGATTFITHIGDGGMQYCQMG